MMRYLPSSRMLSAVLLMACAGTTTVLAQRPDSASLDERALPREIAREVVNVYNAPGTLRSSGRLDISADQDIQGDVASLGPLTIAGRVRGRVYAINADVVLKPTARIDGDLVVVGGRIEGKDDAYIGGDVRIYRQPLTYAQRDDRIEEEHGESDHEWRDRWRHRHRYHSFSNLRITSAKTYNRVEGLPVLFGPVLRNEGGWGRFTVNAYAVARTVDAKRWSSSTIGHDLRGELRLGRPAGIAFGGRAVDVVAPVESWQLTDEEVGLASFFLHRDYRDYYAKHGGWGYASVYIGEGADITASYGAQRWGALAAQDPLTLFRNDAGWRANPQMDEGVFHIANGTFRLDTRNDKDDPWTGWFVVADYERGTGRYTSFVPRSANLVDPSVDAAPSGPITYQRAFVDLRRYNRLAPSAQLNVRLVAGAQLDGDPLPLERRFSVGGQGTLPGFDFRRYRGDGEDMFTCSSTPTNALPGRPAECQRVALAEVEYRGSLRLDLGFFDDNDWYRGNDAPGKWVLFADAGRGWMANATPGQTSTSRFAIPPLNSFRTDMGFGFDFDVAGIFVAKSLSDPGEPANVFVRLNRRF